MPQQTIVWTALPHGSDGPNAAGTKLRLSVHVAPRLWDTDLTVKKMKLGSFPDFAQWPTTIAGATYAVSFNGAAPLAATVVTPQPLRPDVWAALFNDDTNVVPFRFPNMTGIEVISFPAAVIEGAIRDIYVNAATNPDYGRGKDLPPLKVLAADPGLVDVAEVIPPPKDYVPVPIDDKPKFVGTNGPELEPSGPAPGGGGLTKGCCGCGCLAAPLHLLHRFLKWLGFMAMLPFVMGGIGGGVPRNSSKSNESDFEEGPVSANRAAFDDLHAYLKASDKSVALSPDFEDKYDFHQMVSTLGDYPNLLRYTGLVVDLEVTLDGPLPANGTVTVTPTTALPLALNTTPPYSPRTHYELGDASFNTEPGPSSDLRNGLLRVDDTNRFQVMQLDVAGSALKVRAAANKIVNDEKNNTVPGTEPKKQGLPALQTAGISIVRPQLAQLLKAIFANSWALNAKLASIDGSPSTPAVGAAPLPKDDLFAEDVVRGYRIDVHDDQSNAWHSLCQRVGTYTFGTGALILDKEHDEGFVQMSVTEPAAQETPRKLRLHESLFTWNGWSLGAPRYGNTILSPKTPPPGTPPDPDDPTQVGKPKNDAVTAFKLETKFTPEPKSLPRLRFGYEYQLRARAVDLAGNSVFDPVDAAFDVTQTEVTPPVKYRRFEPIAPPMVMLRKPPVEGESLEHLVVRSQFNALPADITTERHLVPPKTSQLMAEHHRKFDGGATMDSSLTAYVKAGTEAGSLMQFVDPVDGTRKDIPGADEVKEGPHTHWVQTNPTFDLAYLPDPYARGVLLLGLPGMTTPDEIVEPGVTIVNKIPFDGPWPNLVPMRLRVQGIVGGVAAATPNWDKTNRVLTVQVPQGETYEVELRSYFQDTHLDRMAIWKWTEEKGDPQIGVLRDEAIAGRNWLQLPSRTLVLVHAVQQPLTIPSIADITADKKLGDTLATLDGHFTVDAKSTGKVDVDASWVDPFDDLAKPTFVAATDVVKHEARLAEVRIDDAANNAAPFTALKHALGDTKYHEVSYTPVAATRFREYFPTAITDDPKNLIRPTPTEVGVPTSVDILNSARPAAPKPLYVVPLFQWERTIAGGLHSSTRNSGGLRVYLDRPWYSSGKGELLGVTLKPAALAFGSDEAELLKKYTSQWGMDPLWPAAETFPLFAAMFDTPAAPAATVRLAEIEQDVTVIGYEPQFDSVRNLWFCDILINPGTAYFPFARLALVRYQPKSVNGAEISPVVMADFIQIVPKREVRYDVTNVDTTGAITIVVNGPAYVFNDSASGSPRMIVRLEEQSEFGTGSDDELGWKQIAAHQLKPVTQKKDNTIWAGIITATLPRPNPLRIVVLEAEAYDADAASTDPTGALLGADLPNAGGFNIAGGQAPQGYRITFADAVTI